MFDLDTPLYDPSNTANSSPDSTSSFDSAKRVSLMLDEETALRILDDEIGSKKKRKKPGPKKGQSRRSGKNCSESGWKQLYYFFLATQKETNAHIEKMMELALGSSRRVLRKDIIEANYEDVDSEK